MSTAMPNALSTVIRRTRDAHSASVDEGESGPIDIRIGSTGGIALSSPSGMWQAILCPGAASTIGGDISAQTFPSVRGHRF